MRENRKKKGSLSGILVGIGMTLNVIFFIYLFTWFPWPYTPLAPPPHQRFYKAITSNPLTFDPLNARDSVSIDVLDQVAEGLFTYNISDPNFSIINLLAESYYWINATTLHIGLRMGIEFHDRSRFDANAVKWNLDRLNYFCNASNATNRMAPFNTSLPAGSTIAKSASLFFLPNGNPIINRVEKTSPISVNIYLTEVFAPFLDLLCNVACKMLSPESTPAIRFIELYEAPIGTGPFELEYFRFGKEISFEMCSPCREHPYLEKMVYYIVPSAKIRSLGLMYGDFHYVSNPLMSLIPTFENNPDLTVYRFTEETGIPGVDYYYLGMNNKKINVTWRHAISYAINYTYIEKIVYNNSIVKANSPISPAFGTAYNASVHAGRYNLTFARQTLVNAGITSLNISDDDAWRATTLLSLNYSYNVEDSIKADLFPLLQSWLDNIGIDVVGDGSTHEEFLDKMYVNHDDLGIFWDVFEYDYLDPYNLLNQLFNPTSSFNSANVNDTWLNNKINEAQQTTNEAIRDDLYQSIQWYLTEVLYTHCLGYHPNIVYIHNTDLHGFTYNALNKLNTINLQFY
ncbi:MAG: ABC transporter substrate-binding protein [Candidatus Lokiarchaeota archaeon]|nr:ABC transporter substrate-binding protein [Candidatus Lokiarchaeota archaeon]